MPVEILREQLETCNRDLADITGVQAAELQYQSGDSGRDSLFIYGIVGGKDVGKTSLINQLAGSRISIDSDILDEGTKTAVAYCHEDDETALLSRLGTVESRHILFVKHNRDELKNVVLMDFPDFDSRFVQHLDEVKRFSKFLQGMVWVTTPRKYGDHEFIRQFTAVAQSHDYYFVVLNKVDQIAKHVTHDEIRREVYGYLKEECTKNQVTVPDERRLFLISALSPVDYEFPLLKERLVRVHSPQEIAKAKLKNLQSEFEKNIQRIKRHYRLDEAIRAFDHIIEQIQRSVQEAFSMEYSQMVQNRVSSLETLQRRISTQLFSQRVKQLPLLWLVYYPLSGLIASIGGLMSFQQSGQKEFESSKEILRLGSVTASMRLVQVTDKLRNQHPNWQEQFDQIQVDSVQIHERFGKLLHEYEDMVTQNVLKNIKPPGIMHKTGIYLPLIWVPFLQPMLYQLSKIESNVLSLDGFWALFGIILSLFSASTLLVSIIFLIVFYVVWLGVLYSLCVKRVQREGDEEFSVLWYDRYIPWIYNTLSQPLQLTRQNLQNQNAELGRIQESLLSEIQQNEAL